VKLFHESRDQARPASECDQRGDLYIGAYLEEFRGQDKTFKVEFKCFEAEAVTLTGDPLYPELWFIISEPFIPEDKVVGTRYFIARIYKENGELHMDLSVYHIDLFARLRIPTLKSSLHIGYCNEVIHNWSGCYSTKLFHDPVRCKSCREHAKSVSEHVSRCAECKTFDHFAVNKCSKSAHRDQWAFPTFPRDIALQLECVNCPECTAYRQYLYVSSQELEAEMEQIKLSHMKDPNSDSYYPDESDDPEESDCESDPEEPEYDSDSDNFDRKSQRNIDRSEEKRDCFRL
jgi:hypothetical protein